MTDNTHHSTPGGIPADPFEDIRPYDDHQFRQKIDALVHEPGFEHAVRYIMPELDYNDFVGRLMSVQSQMDFQVKVMGPFLELLVSRTTQGLSMDGDENYDPATPHLFITNHRDIVLDASFLNLCFIRRRQPITQVAIGNNLLIYDWITDLVKLNRSFIVKRDVRMRQALEAAQHLSEYIHHTIGEHRESIWIAQREGRAKDSNDLTQESVVKMLSLAGGGDPAQNLEQLNIMPVSISYEHDPNDYLKVREFLLRRRDPDHKKSQRDDLNSMEVGLLGQKGRIHFHLGACINRELPRSLDRNETIRTVCSLIDRSIHCGYRLFPCNYIAYDRINGTQQYTGFYSVDDAAEFDEYIALQLDKIHIPGITADESEYMRTMMLSMYANPLKNQLDVLDCANAL